MILTPIRFPVWLRRGRAMSSVVSPAVVPQRRLLNRAAARYSLRVTEDTRLSSNQKTKLISRSFGC